MLLESIKSVFKIPELRNKVLFTLGILAIYRLGGQIPIPGIDRVALGEFFAGTSQTIFGLYDMFVGGAFTRATVFALGIMPYISASIIFQLMGAVVPSLQKLQKEGEAGPQKNHSIYAIWYSCAGSSTVFGGEFFPGKPAVARYWSFGCTLSRDGAFGC